MSSLNIEQISLVSILKKHFNLPEKDLRLKVDLIVDDIISELSKGHSVHHPYFFKFTPVIREEGYRDIPFLKEKVYSSSHIYTRFKLHRGFVDKLKKYELKNLDLL